MSEEMTEELADLVESEMEAVAKEEIEDTTFIVATKDGREWTVKIMHADVFIGDWAPEEWTPNESA